MSVVGHPALYSAAFTAPSVRDDRLRADDALWPGDGINNRGGMCLCITTHRLRLLRGVRRESAEERRIRRPLKLMGLTETLKSDKKPEIHAGHLRHVSQTLRLLQRRPKKQSPDVPSWVIYAIHQIAAFIGYETPKETDDSIRAQITHIFTITERPH